ncbi:hypothetical protein GC105_11405 [Alkalibaculum sp. M08DMB]|uniref:Uncharacterized protein n=1 Tax=Alkalibaculum sporogenes TaxID=2655001 RepID=A0A6A7KAL6_9FIRM|nr:hypothetical protein [Alkalibaculum sporogenes]MPW26395.1 hypothetical protein [Alkalibaculum sporogenes]
MKICLLIDSDNQIYAYAPCHVLEEDGVEYHSPSLIVDGESQQLGCRMVMIDEEDIPNYYDLELWQCRWVEGNLEYCHEKVEFVEMSVLRDERNKAFAIGDKYQNFILWESLTEEQRQEYRNWREAWLNVTDNKVKPEKPIWFD